MVCKHESPSSFLSISLQLLTMKCAAKGRQPCWRKDGGDDLHGWNAVVKMDKIKGDGGAEH